MIRITDWKLVLTHWNNLVPIVREQFHSLGKILHFQKCNSSTKREKSISKLSSNQCALCEVVIGNFNHVKKFTWGRFLRRCAHCYIAPQHISIWFLAIHICLHDNFCPAKGGVPTNLHHCCPNTFTKWGWCCTVPPSALYLLNKNG